MSCPQGSAWDLHWKASTPPTPPRCHLPFHSAAKPSSLGSWKARLGQEPTGASTAEILPESIVLSLFSVALDRWNEAGICRPGFPMCRCSEIQTGSQDEGCAFILCSSGWRSEEMQHLYVRGAVLFTSLTSPGIWCILFPTPGARARNVLPADAHALSGLGSKSLSRRAFRTTEASLCAQGFGL